MNDVRLRCAKAASELRKRRGGRPLAFAAQKQQSEPRMWRGEHPSVLLANISAAPHDFYFMRPHEVNVSTSDVQSANI